MNDTTTAPSVYLVRLVCVRCGLGVTFRVPRCDWPAFDCICPTCQVPTLRRVFWPDGRAGRRIV